jgi:hypothetical protein
MANNYCQTSTQYVLEDSKEIERAEEIIEEFSKVWAKEEDFPEEEGYVPFQYEVESKGIWFYGDEYVDVGRLADLISAFQVEFKMSSRFIFSYACTCSKMRLDEFSGGTFVITPEGEVHHSGSAYDVIKLLENPFSEEEKTIMNEIVYEVFKDDELLNRFADKMDLSDKVLMNLESKISKLMEKSNI